MHVIKRVWDFGLMITSKLEWDDDALIAVFYEGLNDDVKDGDQSIVVPLHSKEGCVDVL